MDALMTLPIHKHTNLTRRISRLAFSTPLEREGANWIIFGKKLTEAHFECIDFYTGYFNKVVDAWKVGTYEVALMSGNISSLHEEVLEELELDFADIWDVPDLSKPGLILMDMDSTAIQIECIDEIAKLAGVGKEVSEVTERAMQGELNFEQSLRQRVGKLENADASILEQVRSVLPMTTDLPPLVATLKSLGWKVAIASGGFTYFSDYLKERLSLDFAQSNTLDIIDGKLTGKVLGQIVGAQVKADILVKLTDEYGIEKQNTVAVGDGANDLVMMEAAGLGVAYHAKPKVEARAQTSVRYSHLGGVLCILSAGLAKQGKLSWQKRV
ncbi:phosphoserine phosphatase [Vibrio salinus]|uniref:phosphoserine phosphatase n=1 Tax=Vibrio salinus TaxID=2899784 RepID=UPI001E5AA0D0|nr:phosphoserine phosphatase [Vibrio salinus]MCE0494306.1 phosphoserine phosphatase [Vibrio salinus]